MSPASENLNDIEGAANAYANVRKVLAHRAGLSRGARWSGCVPRKTFSDRNYPFDSAMHSLQREPLAYQRPAIPCDSPRGKKVASENDRTGGAERLAFVDPKYGRHGFIGDVHYPSEHANIRAIPLPPQHH